MKKMLLTAALAATASYMSAQGCNELFISEYVEGRFNNKALELYNPTPNPINLSDYNLARYSNGSPNAATNQRYTLPDVILEPYQTWVIVIDKRNPEGEGVETPVWVELQAKADHFANPVYGENNTMYFNGNDAMVLSRVIGAASVPVDVIGRIGQDPDCGNGEGGGWNNVGPSFASCENDSESWTTDHSLIKKFDITVGNNTDLQSPWDVSVDWDSIPAQIMGEEGFIVGNWESLGSHDCACAPLSARNADQKVGKLYPNPVGANQMLRFSAPHATARYEVYDLAGKMIRAEVIANLEAFEISISGMNKGIYMLRTYAAGGVYVHKFIVH